MRPLRDARAAGAQLEDKLILLVEDNADDAALTTHADAGDAIL